MKEGSTFNLSFIDRTLSSLLFDLNEDMDEDKLLFFFGKIVLSVNCCYLELLLLSKSVGEN